MDLNFLDFKHMSHKSHGEAEPGYAKVMWGGLWNLCGVGFGCYVVWLPNLYRVN